MNGKRLNVPRLVRAAALAALAVVGLGAGPAWAAAEATDLRVLVDVSGSMKKTDPRNLRRPALRLLVGLLPEGTRAGVWTFGHRVREVVPAGPVDPRWKARARRAAAGIRSNELLTDIEKALETATRDWTGPDPDARRHVILLTDGKVDVGKDPGPNQASRERIRGELLPRLKAHGAAVHTVALSDDADHRLLKTLSRLTDGWSERTEDAEDLDRVFLRLFEKSAPADQVPIDEDNRFTVDASVSDMTLLVFRAPDAGPTRLVDPDGNLVAARLPRPGVSWEQERRYDLVTVEDPAPGTWRIDAKVDPDNRVMVVTNLRLAVDPLPNHHVQSQPLPVVARLEEEGATVTRPGFLELVDFSVDAARKGGEPRTTPLGDAGEPGVYTAAVDPGEGAGVLELRVLAQGATFTREFRHSVRIHESPARVELREPAAPGAGARLEAAVTVALMEPDSVSVAYRPLDPPGAEAVAVPPAEAGEWRATLAPELSGTMVEVRVEATRLDGQPFELAVEQLAPGEAPAEPDPVPLPAEAEKAEEAEQEPGGIDWVRVALWVGVANAILWPLVLLGWLWWRRRKAQRQAVIEEALEV